MNSRSWAIAVLVLHLASATGISQGKRPTTSEQMQFSAEDAGVKRPVAIPGDVLKILSQDEMVRDALEDEKVPSGKVPSSWFSASSIHLSDSGKAGFVVVGEGPLLGANIVTFWVFCATPTGQELVLMNHAHDLIVKKTRWKGHREIEMSAETAVEFTSVLFRWDGKKYSEYKEKSEEIK